jgi:hypothetical protein
MSARNSTFSQLLKKSLQKIRNDKKKIILYTVTSNFFSRMLTVCLLKNIVQKNTSLNKIGLMSCFFFLFDMYLTVGAFSEDTFPRWQIHQGGNGGGLVEILTTLR